MDPERAEGFYTYIRRFWPGLPDGALAPDYAGLRPKIHGPGEPQPDFQIEDAAVHGLEGLIALFGIESPGLTSSLALGEEVAHRLEEPEASLGLASRTAETLIDPPSRKRALWLGSSDG